MTKKEFMRQFGDNLSWFLKHYQLTHRQLAKAIGVSRPTVSQYINGNRLPPPDVVVNIMQTIGCEFDELFDTSDFVE